MTEAEKDDRQWMRDETTLLYKALQNCSLVDKKLRKTSEIIQIQF